MNTQEIIINKHDKKLLDNAYQRAHIIQNSEFYKQKKRKVLFEFDPDKVNCDTIGPSQDNLFAITNMMRPFVLTSEPYYLSKILKKIGKLAKQSKNDEYQGCIKNYHANFKNCMQNSFVKLKVNNTDVTPENVFNLYIYGKYSKQDTDKSKTISDLKNFEPLLHFQFMDMLDGIIQLILRTAHIYILLEKNYKMKIIDA